MPTLDWLNRAQAFTTSGRVPYRLLEEVSVHLPTAKSETSEPESTQPVWASKSSGRCLFKQIVKERDGVGMSGQLDALLA